jgi:transforming growth factor-beta-induced protein
MRRFALMGLTGATAMLLAACGSTAPATDTGATSAATTEADSPLAGDETVTAAATSDTTGAAGATAEGTTVTSGTVGATSDATSAAGATAAATSATSDSMMEETATSATGATSAATSATAAATSDATSAAGATAAATTGTAQGSEDIVAALQADGRFTTLLTAIQAAGLEDELASLPEFTLFAPTDEAFAALPASQLEALLADPTQLSSILLYHVTDTALPASQVTASPSTSVTTLEGQPIEVTVSGSTVTLNGTAQVIATDIEAGQGIVHVIDQVLTPPAQ